MRYISVFSGIEAASVAFRDLGWEPVAFSEIDPFPSAVLSHRFPRVPNLGDITKVDWTPFRGSVDLVVGGSPCQSFSTAGKREGLKGESGLMFEFIRCVREVRPRWFLWENVPGALSSERGQAFGQLLHEMADGGGYGCSWRVLDAQFFGVAQRRRRLFLVGRAGNGFREACQVLFEPDCMRGDTETSREKREELAKAAGRYPASAGFCNSSQTAETIGKQSQGVLTPWDVQSKRVFGGGSVAPTISSGTSEGANIQPCVLTMASGQAHAEIGEDVCPTQSARQYKDPPIAMVDLNARSAIDCDMTGTLKRSGEVTSVMTTEGDSHAEVRQRN